MIVTSRHLSRRNFQLFDSQSTVNSQQSTSCMSATGLDINSPVSRTNPEYIRSSGAHRGETQRGGMGERGIPVCPRGENWRWVRVASGEEEGLMGRGASGCNIILETNN